MTQFVIHLEPLLQQLANVNGSAIGNDKGSSNISHLSPQIGNLSIIGTSRTSITLQAHANITNPTKYSATVPYFNINILVNNTVLGQVVAKDIVVRPGNNTNLLVTAVWDPYTHSGQGGNEVGKELLSQYISGKYQVSACFSIVANSRRLQYIPNPPNPQRHHPLPACARRPHVSLPHYPPRTPPLHAKEAQRRG